MGQRVCGGGQAQNANRAAMQLTPHLAGRMTPSHQGRHHPAPVQQQQAAEQVFGVGANIGTAGVDDLDATLFASFQIGVVGAYMQPAHRPELGQVIQKIPRDDSLPRKNNSPGLAG
jgi:hypothetical protein